MRRMQVITVKQLRTVYVGATRRSPLVLDNIGITVDIDESLEALAKAAKKTSEELTNFEKTVAILNATMGALGDESSED